MIKKLTLAGDIGATKTCLALYDRADAPVRQDSFQNKAFCSLEEIVTRFLADLVDPPVRACLGVAGPVRNNHVRMTNLAWDIDGKALAKQFSMEQVLLVNDLVATAAGAIALPADKLMSLNTGLPDPSGGIGVLAAGTGLGQAFAVPIHGEMQPFPTEGGHSSFAPRNQEQIDLLQFMLKRQGKQGINDKKNTAHVSVERVCSGMAVPDLYAFILTRCRESDWMERKRQLTEQSELTPFLVKSANASLSGGPICEPAVRTVRLFTDILAAEAANLALRTLATGGIYLGGGMVPRLLPFFETERFMGIFSRGVYRQMLTEIPVHIITEPKTALFGARRLAS